MSDNIEVDAAGANEWDGVQSDSESSVIVPLLRPDDKRFFTVQMFGDQAKEMYSVFNDTVLPISGLHGIFQATTYESIKLKFYRYVLGILFQLYGNLLKLQTLISSYQLLISVWLWSTINDIHILPTNIDNSQMRNTEKNTTISYSSNHQNLSMSGSDTTWTFSKLASSYISRSLKERYYRIVNLPIRLGNRALSRSLARKPPYNYETIENATADMTIPLSILFILELNPLVMPPPPIMPLPYLDADKKIVVPSKKETQKVMAKRAEWTLTQHSHKTSEIMRVATEVSRLVTWCAVSGVKELMFYVRDDHGCWDNVGRLQEMIQAQLSSINNQDIDVNISIPNKKEMVDLNEHLDTLKPLPDFHSTKTNTPTPEIGVGMSAFSPTPSSSGTFQVRTVSVILLNHSTAYNPLVTFVESTIKSNSYVTSVNSFRGSLDATIDNLRRPELIVHCPRDRNFQSFLDGLPRFYTNGCPVFYNIKTPSVSFSDFFRIMKHYSKSVKRE